jgi:hypothetical protein
MGGIGALYTIQRNLFLSCFQNPSSASLNEVIPRSASGQMGERRRQNLEAAMEAAAMTDGG